MVAAERSSHVLFSLSSKAYIAATVAPVIIALLASFIVGFAADYESLLNYQWTCGKALLPSISRIINLPKERTFCNLVVGLYVGLRPLITAHYYLLCRRPAHQIKYPRVFKLLVSLIPLSSFSELAFLIALTLVGERENPNLHVVFFVGFCSSSNLYFILVTVLYRLSRFYTVHDKAQTSFKLKATLVTLNFLLMPAISVFFVLYWQLCVRFAYNVFALLEYTTIFTMLMFHCTAYLDFNFSYKIVILK